MTQSYGWAGKILWVDLSDRKITEVPTSDFDPEKYLGGQGLNSKIFWEMGCPDVDAFHPDNPLILSNGPLTGASGPFTRSTVCSIAPQTYPKELFTYSGFGGKFASELKYAGYDAVVIVGKADKPSYLSIQDGEAKINDAGDLWGLDAYETQNALMGRHPRASILVTGPAGENLSRISIMITEGSGAAGQGGYGAVMGSKNLKAIVTHGTGTLRIAKPDDFMALIRQVNAGGEWVGNNNMEWGRYPQKSETAKAAMRDNYLVKFTGCYACPFQCHGVYDMPGVGKGPQMCNDNWYQYSCGDDKMGENIEGLWEGNVLSQKLGLNNFELVGFMLFFFRTIKEHKILTKEDFGLSAIPAVENRKEPEFGGTQAHHDFLQEFLFGLADGSNPLSAGMMRCAEKFGPKALQLANSINPAWGMRSHHIRGVGEALHWATDTRDPFNSCHDYVSAFGVNKTIADHFDVIGGYLDGESEGKHQNIYEDTEHQTTWVQNHQCLRNSLPICEFPSMPSWFFHPPEMDIQIFESKCLSAVTGLDVDVDHLWEKGNRIWNLRRAISVLREDRHKDDDTLCDDMFKEVINVHAPEKLPAPLDREKWDALKDRYYELRGWNVETGRPERAILESLDMKDVADKLEGAGKLG
ncbi:MAG: aldehyde ferredoxin oxidoreductase N-terminal domain-containing protein [Desulfobacterales bacterium]